MIVEAVDITTAPFIFDPVEAFRVAGRINKTYPNGSAMGIEVYPVLPLVPEFGITAERITTWQEFGAHTVRVHLPWMYNWREIGHQAFFGDWYKAPSPGGRLTRRMKEFGMMCAVGPATNNHGVNLAHELGVGVNVHPNVIAGYVAEGRLDWLKSMVPFVLGENSVEFNSPLQKDRTVLGDPRQTVKHDVEGHKLSGFLLAIDHLFGLEADVTPSEMRDKVDQIITMINDTGIREHTKAIHLAMPGHGVIASADVHMNLVLSELARTPFRHPVRVALDLSPSRFKEMEFQGKVDLVRRLRDWILEKTA